MIPYFVWDHFQFLGLTFYSWGILVALGILAGFLLVLHETKKQGRDQGKIIDLSFWLILGGFLSARLFYVVENYNLFQNDFWGIFRVWEGGMTYLGGLIGGMGVLLFFLFFKKIKRAEWFGLLDILVVGLALGLGIGRIGCFLVNDHLGAVTTLPWGIAYWDGSLRHPVALYLAFEGWLLFFLLNFLRSKIEQNGAIALIFLGLHSLDRFVLDFSRERNSALPFVDQHYDGLTMAQIVSLICLGAVVFLLIWKHPKINRINVNEK